MHGRSIANPACFVPATYLFYNICAQANKMPKGPLFKAAGNGNTAVRVTVIRAIGQLQTVPHIPTHHGYHIHPLTPASSPLAHHVFHTHRPIPFGWTLSHITHHRYQYIHYPFSLQLLPPHAHTPGGQKAAGLRHQTRCRKGQFVLIQVRLVLAHRRYWRVAQ